MEFYFVWFSGNEWSEKDGILFCILLAQNIISINYVKYVEFDHHLIQPCACYHQQTTNNLSIHISNKPIQRNETECNLRLKETFLSAGKINREDI